MVEVRGVTRRFGDTVAVDDLSLEVRAGEFLSLLGPSGCGKTTTLRLIAGFERPDAGAVLLDGVDMTRVPPHRRDVNTVFQSYALFPHLSVADNVAYGLRQRGVPRPQRRRLAGEMLELVRLPGMEDRRPRELSGGQQQRVALARALVLEPRVLLLDEPLGALDLRIRRRLQVELKRIQERLRITFVHVTHDQEEALAMSDRVAVLNGGRIEQLGTPRDVYDRPATRFVAEFIGEMNLIRHGGRTVAVRPEHLRLVARPADGRGLLEGELLTTMVVGPMEQLVVRVDDGQEVIIRRQREGDGAPALRSGGRVAVAWPEESALAFGEERDHHEEGIDGA